MATKAAITINFNTAIKQADKIKEDADRIRTERQELEQMISKLGNVWQSDGAAKYIAKCRMMAEKMAKTASDLDKVESTIRQAAMNYYKAEMFALEVIKTKNS